MREIKRARKAGPWSSRVLNMSKIQARTAALIQNLKKPLKNADGFPNPVCRQIPLVDVDAGFANRFAIYSSCMDRRCILLDCATYCNPGYLSVWSPVIWVYDLSTLVPRVHRFETVPSGWHYINVFFFCICTRPRTKLVNPSLRCIGSLLFLFVSLYFSLEGAAEKCRGSRRGLMRENKACIQFLMFFFSYV